jgi:hypothetical protein
MPGITPRTTQVHGYSRVLRTCFDCAVATTKLYVDNVSLQRGGHLVTSTVGLQTRCRACHEAYQEQVLRCSYCDAHLGSIEHRVHRDGVMNEGPQVPLCFACASFDTPTLEALMQHTSELRMYMNDPLPEPVPPPPVLLSDALALARKAFE